MKIVCLGPNKTGTSSLSAAFEILGFKSHHEIYTFHEKAGQALQDGKKIFSSLEAADAFSDIFFPCDMAVPTHELLKYQNVDRFIERIKSDYSDVKFILNVRDIESWLNSREKHVRNNQLSENYTGAWLEIDRSAWREEFNQLVSKVRGCFKDESGLLVVDIVAGDGWEKLCPFLGCPIPNVPFPRENKASNRTVRKIKGLLKFVIPDVFLEWIRSAKQS